MDNPIVSVRGEALLEVDTEIATLNVVVSSRDRDRDETLRHLDERSDAALALLASFGDAVDRVETAAVRVSPEFKDNRPREKVVGYRGVIRHTVTVSGFDRLGDLVSRLAEQDLVEVSGPWWQLRRDSDVYRTARADAAREAVRRAREYAEALGSRLVGLVELADAGLLGEAVTHAGPVSPGAPAPMAMRAGGPSPAPAPVVLDLEPVRQVVRATVEARFLIAPPESL